VHQPYELQPDYILHIFFEGAGSEFIITQVVTSELK